MFVIITTAIIILHITVAKDIVTSTTNKKSDRYDNDILKTLLARLDQMEMNINTRLDRQDKRLEQQETRLERLEANVLKVTANELSMQDNIKNLSVAMEKIVEQQRVITAEIFTVSQTLPFCCCHYQNTITPEQVEITTTATSKNESTTSEPTPSKKSYCAEAMGESGGNGVYKIDISNSGLDPFDVYCMKSVDNKETHGTWLIIQRRVNKHTDFHREWNTYKLGFGVLNRNYWIGLDKLYALTNSAEQEFWVQLELNNGTKMWMLYSNFSIGNETELYAIKTVGNFKCSLCAGIGDNALNVAIRQGAKFSTYDNANDGYDNCSYLHRAGWWWFSRCQWCNLNGIYGDQREWPSHRIFWRFHPENKDQYFSYVHIAIRPSQQTV